MKEGFQNLWGDVQLTAKEMLIMHGVDTSEIGTWAKTLTLRSSLEPGDGMIWEPVTVTGGIILYPE